MQGIAFQPQLFINVAIMRVKGCRLRPCHNGFSSKAEYDQGDCTGVRGRLLTLSCMCSVVCVQLQTACIKLQHMQRASYSLALPLCDTTDCIHAASFPFFQVSMQLCSTFQLALTLTADRQHVLQSILILVSYHSFSQSKKIMNCRLPELTSIPSSDDHASSLHQLPGKLQQKLNSDSTHTRAIAAATADSGTALAAETPLSQQLVGKPQQKLDTDSTHSTAVAAGPTGSGAALAADCQHHTDVQRDMRHHKGSHAHFADESISAMGEACNGGSITGCDESITAVRGGGAGSRGAEGTFWRGLGADGCYRAVPGMWRPSGDCAHFHLLLLLSFLQALERLQTISLSLSDQQAGTKCPSISVDSNPFLLGTLWIQILSVAKPRVQYAMRVVMRVV